jgi:hypothetical protein
VKLTTCHHLGRNAWKYTSTVLDLRFSRRLKRRVVRGKLAACFCWFLTEDGGDVFFQYIGQTPNYTELQPRRSYSLYLRSLTRLYAVAQVQAHNATASRRALGSTQPPIQWVPEALSLGVKRPGREADHSPPASTKVKKMWVYTSTAPYAFMA